jgi:hypothetical protein
MPWKFRALSAMLADMEAGLRPSFERLTTISPQYATLSVANAFTWSDCLADVPPGEWYMVAFRSIRRDDADEARLTAHDDWAHIEATGAPGFVHYFRGPANALGECMSFCLWTSRKEARAAAGGPAHVQAAALTFEAYAHYVLEFHRVRRLAEGGFTFESYDSVVVTSHPDQLPEVPPSAADNFASPVAPF